MTRTEQRAAVSLAAIFSTRMLGLFMILPVFALYAEDLEGVTPQLVGLAIGIYGLSQAVLQIPFGMLSDKWGRRPLITFGLVIFAIGSAVAAMADSIHGIILGRALQGAGAISGVVMALAADLTREEHRLKAMAMMGASIGLSFTAALIAGPLLNKWIGVPGIFWVTATLALGGMLVLYTAVPKPVHSRPHRDATPVRGAFGAVLRDGELLRLNYGVFALHLMLTASFVVVPLVLRDTGIAADHHWMVYLSVLLISLVVMVPFIIVAEKRRRMKQVFVGAVALLTVAEAWLMFAVDSMLATIAGLLVFFIAFNLLEASLPSLVAKTTPPDKKGTAMGVYGSFQFLGAFVGGAAGGWLHAKAGLAWVFGFCVIVALVWVALAATMRSPRYLSGFLLKVGSLDEPAAQHLAARLTQVRGVAEAVVIPEEGVAYLKVDNRALDRDALREFSVLES